MHWVCFRYRQLQAQTDSKISEIQSEVKMRTFEFERLQLVLEEVKKNLKHAQMDKEKCQKKNEVG